jgi:2-iminoacetate synthase
MAEKPDAQRVRELLAKARELNGLRWKRSRSCSAWTDPGDSLAEVMHTAKEIKQLIYGTRLVMFAPLYVSNLCSNECSYCAFRATNKEAVRRTSDPGRDRRRSPHPHRAGTQAADPGGGRDHAERGHCLHPRFDQDDLRDKAWARRDPPRERQPCAADGGRVPPAEGRWHRHISMFPGDLPPPDLRRRPPQGTKKSDYDWRATVFDRAMTAGIDDVGMGVLYGLYDWRWETLALMQHIAHLEREFGCGPHTLSFPRIEPASGSELASSRPYAVSDADFLKLIAIMRLAVPYTGMIMSSRERPEMRRKTLNSASRRSPPDAAPIPAVTRTVPETRREPVPVRRSSLARRGSARRARPGTSRRSAPHATAPGARERTSWTWPSPATSSTTASPMLFQR